jgi:hypothetical protein
MQRADLTDPLRYTQKKLRSLPLSPRVFAEAQLPGSGATCLYYTPTSPGTSSSDVEHLSANGFELPLRTGKQAPAVRAAGGRPGRLGLQARTPVRSEEAPRARSG